MILNRFMRQCIRFELTHVVVSSGVGIKLTAHAMDVFFRERHVIDHRFFKLLEVAAVCIGRHNALIPPK